MFQPTASLDVLRRRSQLLEALRRLFLQAGYWEVETPLLSADVCVDAWIDPLAVEIPGTARPFYLQTSPEFGMKRLLAAGADAIFQITRSFRRGERGPLHNPEFTLVEWYRVGDSYYEQMDFVEELVRRVATAAEFTAERVAVPVDRFPRLSYDEAFERFAGTCVLHMGCQELVDLAGSGGIVLPSGIVDDRDGLLNLLLAEIVEPGLREMPAVFVYDYPASQSALARVRHDECPVGERFELYLRGMEICNGYQELTDAEELRRRAVTHNERREMAGKEVLPVDSRLLDAMAAGLPECSGVALGFDRLVMWCLGAESIDSVLAFPIERA